MNQNTEQVSQNKGLNEFERAKIYYTKKVAEAIKWKRLIKVVLN